MVLNGTFAKDIKSLSGRGCFIEWWANPKINLYSAIPDWIWNAKTNFRLDSTELLSLIRDYACAPWVSGIVVHRYFTIKPGET